MNRLRMRRLRTLSPGALIVALAVGCLAGPASGAALPDRLAPPVRGAAPPAEVATYLSFPELRTTTGRFFELFVEDCARHADLQVLLSEHRGDAVLSHDLGGRLADCSVNATATSGQISAAWPSGLRVSLRLSAIGRPAVTFEKLSPGCDETETTVRFAATGSITSTEESAAFGLARASRTTADFDRQVYPACSGGGYLEPPPEPRSGPSNRQERQGRRLSGLWDNGLKSIDARNVAGYPSQVFFEAPLRGPAGTFGDLLNFSVTGGGAFLPTANLAGATLNFATPLSTGALSFSAGRGCPAGVRARDGSLSGTATISDPVLGPVTLTGAEVGLTQLAVLSARSDRCRPVESP